MEQHFSSFNFEGMRAFAQSLASDARERMEFVDKTRRDTQSMRQEARTLLGEFGRKNRERASQLRDSLAAHAAQRGQDERARRDSARRAREARHVASSELRSGVHALLGRFQIGRQHMAAELKATADVWKNRGAFAVKPQFNRAVRFSEGAFEAPAASPAVQEAAAASPAMQEEDKEKEAGFFGHKKKK